jgi:hypothetical protein
MKSTPRDGVIEMPCRDVRRLIFLAADAVSWRKRLGVACFDWMTELAGRYPLTSEMSASGHELERASAQSEEPILLGPREAADLLGLSTRQVRRLANDLDGEWIGTGRVYRLEKVLEYAEGRHDGRRTRGGIRSASEVTIGQ